MAEIRMPKMGDGMEEGTILRWLKNEGDTIAVEEPIAEVETDKANVEIPSEEAGTLLKILAKEGDTVPVGVVIALVEGPGGGVAATSEAKSAPTAAEAAPGGVAGQASRPATAGPTARVKASPLARRMAEALGIDLSRVAGSGGGVGRIVARDVEAARASGAQAPAAPAAPRAAPPATAAPRRTAPRDAPGVVPTATDTDISKMRRAIARRVVHSKQTAPHFYVTMPVEMDRAVDMLAQLNTAAPDRKVTLNDLVVRACAVALTAFPDVNVSFTPEEKVRRYDAIHIGIAVGTDNGLMIPVITDCGHRTLREVADTARSLVRRARAYELTPQEMSGGTFTVSNLGMFGVEEFAAILNPPEAAILAVGAAAREAVVGADGTIAARTRMRLTLSCDHRAVDGLLAARFLQEVRRLLESPVLLLP
ncbi:MAG TPA: dihydrolipoamide acetyltransferase family protein [Chthonomonadales bacterium]|nr:dihydrolipoamide acetyltransferase family protein [Chthonomonadales bacterium]